MAKKRDSKKTVDEKINEVMSLLGQRSAEVRQKKWGKREFVKKMREYGKLGGRPPKSKPKEGKKQ